MGPAGLLLAALAHAAPADPAPPVELRWSGPAGCPDEEEVLESMEIDPDAMPVTAEATARQDPTGWSLTLRIDGPAGVDARELHGESCAALAEAAALLIGVAASPRAAEERGALTDGADTPPNLSPGPEGEPPETPPEPEPQPEPVPPPELRDVPASPASISGSPPDPIPARVRADVAIHTRAAGLLQLGTLLPAVTTGGVELATGLTRPWARVEARGGYLAPRTIRDSDNPSVGAEVDGWFLGASGCGHWDSARRLFVPLCGGAQAGRTRARGFGLEQAGVGRGAWVHAVVDAGLGVRLAPRWAVLASAQAVVSLRRPSFRVRGAPVLFQAGPAAGRVTLGIEFSPRVRRATTKAFFG